MSTQDPRQAGDRFVCPFCHSEAFGPHDCCCGSFLDTAHPMDVRPVFVPAGEDEEKVTAEARERYICTRRMSA